MATGLGKKLVHRGPVWFVMKTIWFAKTAGEIVAILDKRACLWVHPITQSHQIKVDLQCLLYIALTAVTNATNDPYFM